MLIRAVQLLLAAQLSQANVAGTVTDAETSLPVEGAVVTLPDLGRGASTDSAGRYAVLTVPAGPTHLTVRCVGYAPRSLHALVPRFGVLEINVTLVSKPVPLAAVDVATRLEIRGAESSGTSNYPDREISALAVRNYPLLSEPDAFAALAGGEVALTPEAPSGIHIRGGASDQTAYLLDGIPVFSPYHAVGVLSAWNPDALSRTVLLSSAPSAAYPHALSGVVEAATRAPGANSCVQGSVSSTQARLTLDGPLGSRGAGYLLSARSVLHDVIAPSGESSYLRGQALDWLAKLEAQVFGGHVRLLGYGSDNEINTAAATEAGAGLPFARNRFEWAGQSVGAEWRRTTSGGTLRVRGWSAVGHANSRWTTSSGPIAMDGTRRDHSFLAAFEHRSRAITIAELRFERHRTAYVIDSDSADGPRVSLEARSPFAIASVQQTRPLGAKVEIDLGTAATATGRDRRFGPHAQLRWKPVGRLRLSGSYSRTHQFEQSLRNPESVIGTIFPADVYLGAGIRGVPVAESDLGVIAAAHRPWPGISLGAQGYVRRSRGLLLVAPRDGAPFSTGGFTIGSAEARGISLDAAASSAHWGLVAAYGWQRVRYAHLDSTYTPEHGAAHTLQGGVILYPDPTASVRLGITAILGRRTTVVPEGLDWVGYTFGNQGMEVGGSPNYGDEPLGATALPAYVRVDVGARKHWHLHAGGRDVMLGLFGTATNILGRTNLLTYVRDRSSGRLVGIELRPPTILVAGLDWRF